MSHNLAFLSTPHRITSTKRADASPEVTSRDQKQTSRRPERITALTPSVSHNPTRASTLSHDKSSITDADRVPDFTSQTIHITQGDGRTGRSETQPASAHTVAKSRKNVNTKQKGVKSAENGRRIGLLLRARPKHGSLPPHRRVSKRKGRIPASGNKVAYILNEYKLTVSFGSSSLEGWCILLIYKVGDWVTKILLSNRRYERVLHGPL